MHEDSTLITTLVASIVCAFIFGLIAKRLKLPSILGYMIAGILIGPHTPGYAGDVALASQLSDVGVILLMFGVGLHFSLKDMLHVRRVALPGALIQVSVGVALGFGLGLWGGFSPAESLTFAFPLSIASTVVALRGLENRNLLGSQAGKITIGWLIVEDMLAVIVVVLFPVLAPLLVHGGDLDLRAVGYHFIVALLKIGVFAGLMVVIGRRLLPGLLVMIAKTKSRELSSLGILAIALGFAYCAYALFDASFALGAFLAGLVLNESEIGHKAAEHSLPLRDTFAVLFFVAAGMLFNPTVILNEPLTILMALAVILIGASAVAFVVTRICGLSVRESAIVSTSLGQIGEFSFIFAGLARSLGVMPVHLYDAVLASALISIGLNPFFYRLVDRLTLKKA